MIPQRLNQQHKLEEYTIDACSKDQKKVLSYILQYFKKWYELDKTPESQETFTPLRMTLCGVAGSGKSTLINTLVTAIRKITHKTNSVYVCGPTGSAAFNAGGETCHQLFNIQARLYNPELSAQALKSLMSKLENTIALIIDERSMVSSLLLGTMENYCRQAAFKGTKAHLSWGGLPIIILVGDDHQLPPIDEGAFFSLEKQTRRQRTKVEEQFVQNGMNLFLEFGKNVMTLAQSKRVLEGQIRLQQILNGVRGSSEKSLSLEDAEYLCSFHIDNKDCFNQQDKEQIKKDALYLFANVESKNVHNNHALKEINTQDNPVAMIKAQTNRLKDDTRSRNMGHYDNKRTPTLVNIARNSLVQLTGTNLCPKWGLYHGARGKVLDIVYHPEHSPPDNLPLYVLLDIPQYCGPSFIEITPIDVPIAPIKVPCKNVFCCSRTYIPLRLAFAQTIHTFQGQNSGPVEIGQSPNAIPKVGV
jgi:energy-coupling factor transporter ATP-binding protein EcfA2